MIDQPPILGPHMNNVCDLVQRWLDECNAHEDCTPLDDTPMPTRVLALVGDDTQPSIRLIESKGRQERYLALSHCWGEAGVCVCKSNMPKKRQTQNVIYLASISLCG